MRSIDENQFYLAGWAIHPLTELDAARPFSETWYSVWNAANWVEWIWHNKLVPLVVSREAAGKLAKLLREVAPDEVQAVQLDFTKTLEEQKSGIGWRIQNAAKDFETVFSAELRTLPCYLVNRKGIYDTSLLIEHA